MGTRERPADRGRRRSTDALRRLGTDFRLARIGAGLSLRDAAQAAGSSRSQLARFERGELRRLDVPDVGAWCAVVGLEVGIRAYPAGDPIRDRAHALLLERFRRRLHPTLRWAVEVPLPIRGDLRAWDARVSAPPPYRWRVRVEAETRLADGQALARRLQLKIRDDPHGQVVLLLSDTRANRAALATIRPALADLLPLDTRETLAALSSGREPRSGGVVVV